MAQAKKSAAERSFSKRTVRANKAHAKKLVEIVKSLNERFNSVEEELTQLNNSGSPAAKHMAKALEAEKKSILTNLEYYSEAYEKVQSACDSKVAKNLTLKKAQSMSNKPRKIIW